MPLLKYKHNIQSHLRKINQFTSYIYTGCTAHYATVMQQSISQVQHFGTKYKWFLFRSYERISAITSCLTRYRRWKPNLDIKTKIKAENVTKSCFEDKLRYGNVHIMTPCNHCNETSSHGGQIRRWWCWGWRLGISIPLFLVSTDVQI